MQAPALGCIQRIVNASEEFREWDDRLCDKVEVRWGLSREKKKMKSRNKEDKKKEARRGKEKEMKKFKGKKLEQTSCRSTNLTTDGCLNTRNLFAAFLAAVI